MDILDKLSKYKYTISMDNVFVVLPLILIVIVVIIILYKRFFKKKLRVSQIVINGVTLELNCNKDVKRIAHCAWTELITRKLAIPFDQENDVIVEVYDSWYSVYAQFRSIIKELTNFDNSDVNNLISLLLEVLNTDLRNHLTKYQARFRFWYKSELEKNTGEEPQIIQKKYPNYNELVLDIVKVNNRIIDLTNKLDEIRRK